MKRPQYFEQPAFIPIFTDYNYFSGKCIGITGQRGVLGGILSERLAAHNIRVETYPSDITDAANLREWFKKHHFDYFFHFAAIVPVTRVAADELKAHQVNVGGTLNICSQIIETQPRCWLFLASSSHIYKGSQGTKGTALKVGAPEEPGSFYGITKLAAERIATPILDQGKIDYCIGRIFSFSSKKQKEPFLVPTLCRKIEELAAGDTLEIINPDSVRDILDAETTIDCVLHLAQKRFKGILNIGSGEGMSIQGIACHVMKLLKKEVQVRGVNKSHPDSFVADVSALKQALSGGERL